MNGRFFADVKNRTGSRDAVSRLQQDRADLDFPIRRSLRTDEVEEVAVLLLPILRGVAYLNREFMRI